MTKYWFLGELNSCKWIWFAKALSKPAACIYRQSRVCFVTDHVKPSLWMLNSEGRLFINAATNVKWVEFCMQSCAFLQIIDAIGMTLIACIRIYEMSAWKEGELYATQFISAAGQMVNGSRSVHVRFCVNGNSSWPLWMKLPVLWKQFWWQWIRGSPHLAAFWRFRQTCGFFIIILRLCFHFVAIRMCGRGS